MSTSNLPNPQARPPIRIEIETRPGRVADEFPASMAWEDIEHDVLLDIDDKITLTIDGRAGSLSDWRDWAAQDEA